MKTNVLHFNSNKQTESKDDVVYCTFNLFYQSGRIAGCYCFIQILPLAVFYSGIVKSLVSSVFMQLLKSGDIWQF